MRMIDCEDLVKIYKTRDLEVLALQGLDLAVEAGEMMAVIGNSGSGKSTLLNLLGGLDRPSAGRLLVDGQDLLALSDPELIAFKRETVGFVWQNNARNLIPYLTARENVELPMLLSESPVRKERALELLERVDLSDRSDRKLQELSGGEQQRVAIAIALANEPRLLLADEPTGSVDSTTSDRIMDLLKHLNRETGVTVIIVTHDRRLSQKVDRVVAIRDGKTSSELIRTRSYAAVLEEMNRQRGGAIAITGDTEDTLDQTHTEVLVMDRAARVQLPAAYLEELGLSRQDRLRVDLEDGRIVLSPFRQEQEDPEAETKERNEDE